MKSGRPLILKSATGNETLSATGLKGESVVAAIFPSRMEVSYCTSVDFFVAKPAK